MLIELCSPVDLELIEMSQALNRIVGEEVIATVALPPFPASIKDGYAVHSADGAGNRRVRTAVVAGSSNSALSGQFLVIEGHFTRAPVRTLPWSVHKYKEIYYTLI